MQTKTNYLLDMLRYRRPDNSHSERKFIARFIDSIPGMGKDVYGNRIFRIGNSETMISCHTDSVHDVAGMQRIRLDAKGVITRANQEKGKQAYTRECLGADDAAGMYAALRMIEANVPALYVFHRAEERGGLGSDFIACNSADMLHGIKRCIALDRRGTSDIITFQMVGRTCSEIFANALADKLGTQGMHYAPCPFGSFTDSANYTDLIPECTNVSVGYQYEHSWRESLDTVHLETLIDALCTIDLESLPTSRIAGTYEDYVKPRTVYAFPSAKCDARLPNAYRADSISETNDEDFSDNTDGMTDEDFLDAALDTDPDLLTSAETERLDKLLNAYEYL